MSVDIYNVVTKVLTRGDEVVIPAGAEPDLIASARANNVDALVALIRGYGPAIRKAAKMVPHLDDEEVASAVLEAVAEALADAEASLAPHLPRALREAFTEASRGSQAYSIPARTLSRYFSILRKAEGDPGKALSICAEHHMTRETFMAVTEALVTAEPVLAPDGEVLWHVTTPEPLEDEATSELLAACWQAVDSDEELILQSLYGFLSYGAPRTPEETSYYTGIPKRDVVKLKRTGLTAMREALGLFDIEDPDTEKELAR